MRGVGLERERSGRGPVGGVVLPHGQPQLRAGAWPSLKALKLGAWPKIGGVGASSGAVPCGAWLCSVGAASGSGMSLWGRVVLSARARSPGLVTSRADGAVAGDGRVRFGRRQQRERRDETMSDSGEQNYGERVIHGA